MARNDYSLNGTERPWAFGFEYPSYADCANGAPYLDINLDRKFCRVTGATAVPDYLNAGSSAVSRVLTRAGQPLGAWITSLGEDRSFDVNVEGRDAIRLMSYVEGDEFLAWHSIVLHRCLDGDGNPTTSDPKADRATVFLPTSGGCMNAENETVYMANFERPAAQVILPNGRNECEPTGAFTGGYVDLILEGEYCRLTTKVGPADDSAPNSPIIFRVLTPSGEPLAASGPITKPRDLEADVSGKNRVRLFANTDPGEYGVFAGTRLIRC